MRKNIIGQDFSGQDFEGRTLTDYYRDCDFSNCNFKNATLNCVMVNCKLDGSDLSLASIGRLYSPGSTFTDCKFRKGFIHTIGHALLSNKILNPKFNVLSNHQVISEIIRQWVNINIESGVFQDRCFKYLDTLASRKDLSWAELSRLENDQIITMGYFAFEDYPTIYDQVIKHRPELEPEELKNARLNTVSRE